MSFSIAFDYRFDYAGFYDDPAVRAVMDRAAGIWSGLIGDDFEDVRAGTTFSISNPSVADQRETITLSEDIDDLLIFAGARDIPSLGRGGFAGTDAQGDVLRARVSNDFRGTGAVTDFEPWAGIITLDLRGDWSLDPDGPVDGKNDLLTTVLHEIGHVLGLGIAPAFEALVVDDVFTGPNARAVNGGDAVPLEPDSAHVEAGFDDGAVLIDPVTMTGTRKLPGAFDLAMLADIGYEIEGYTPQGSTPAIATQGGETIFGTVLGDRIESLSGDDTLQGGAGNDTLLAGPGDDLVFGQDGDDHIEGGTGNDQLQGGAGDDTLNGGAGGNTVFGQDGNDVLYGGAGDDFLLGGAGNDTLRAGAGNDSLRGGDGADLFVLEPDMGSDTVYDFEFGRDALDISGLDAGARAGITVSGSGVFRHVVLANGGEIYLQGSLADITPDLSLGGEAVQNATLTASFTGITGLFGESADASAYSWLRDGVVIEGATSDSYVLEQADVGAAIRVSATYTASAGSARVTSTATQAVANINNLPTGAVTLAGAPVPGAQLDVITTTLEDADGLGSLSYQWLRGGSPIAGATSAHYTLEAADAGTAIAATVHYTDGQGNTEALTSTAITPRYETAVATPLIDSPVDPPLVLTGDAGNNRLVGGVLSDTIYGGQGSDTLIGGAGDDLIIGGDDETDLRDVIYGGAGNDTIHGGYGNDELRGDAGDDVIAGGFGADTLIGGAGDDRLSGGALGDMIFGGDGDDFINGGFGYDLINGGAGADRFFHLGIFDHGSDWIQDYTSADGDTLVFGDDTATPDQFQINAAFKDNAGDAGVAEAFVIYKPTGQILWALVDGMAQDEINLMIDGTVYDLLG